MGPSHKQVRSNILAKIKIYILIRAELLFTLCYEITLYIKIPILYWPDVVNFLRVSIEGSHINTPFFSSFPVSQGKNENLALVLLKTSAIMTYKNSGTVDRKKFLIFTCFIIVLLLNEKLFLATVFEFVYMLSLIDIRYLKT